MGGKGSGRPKESYKPLSKVFIDISSDVAGLELKLFKKLVSAERKMKSARRELNEALDMYVDFNALKSKINYHIKKHKVREYRRKIKELGK